MCAAAFIVRLTDCGACASGVQAPRAPMRALEQLTLPMRHGGFGLHIVDATAADAALLAGAEKAEAVMSAAPEKCKPLAGASRAPLAAAWQRVWDDVGVECKWDESARELPPVFVRAGLGKTMQGQVSRVVGDRAPAGAPRSSR